MSAEILFYFLISVLQVVQGNLHRSEAAAVNLYHYLAEKSGHRFNSRTQHKA